MAGRLPRVTEYIKNVGKSVGYAAIDVIKEPTETATDFMETNEDLFKVIYSATKNYKRTIKAIDRSVKRSKIYEAAGLGIQNIKEDLKSGKLYNKQREDQQGMEGFMGSEFADFSDFDFDVSSYDASHEDEGESSSSSDTGTIKAISQTSLGLSNSIVSSSMAQSQVIAGAADSIIKTNIASSKLNMLQNEKIHSSLISGFGGVNAGLATVNAILSGPMTNYMNESTKFYGDVSTKLNEISAYLKESTEMQRNLYKQEQNSWKTNKYDEVVSSNGVPDLKAYAKRIYKNLMEFDPTGGMFSGQDEDENLFKALVGSPLKFIPEYLTKLFIPGTIVKALKALDENMQGLFPTMIARFNKMAEDEFGDFNIKGILGSILGIKIDKKTSVSTTKYPKGPIPFDGETKKAIVDIIPAYLARIESAVSGMPERIYDGNSGKFKTVGEVHREYKNIEERGFNEAVSSFKDTFDEWARERIEAMGLGSDDAKNKKYADLKKKFRNVGKQIYRDGGDFRPYQGFGPKGDRTDAEQLYVGPDMFDEEEWLSLMRKAESKNKKGIWKVSQNTIDAIMRANKEMEDIESGYGSAMRFLFMNQYSTLDKNGKLVGLNPNQKDIYKKSPIFRSSNDYLKEILAEVRYIRMYGFGFNSKGKRRKSGGVGTIPNFDTFRSGLFSDEGDPDTPVEDIDKLYWKSQEEKQQTTAEKYGITADNLKNTKAGQAVTSAWDDAKAKIDQLMKSPAKFAVEIIHKADQRVFELMFGRSDGETFRDRAGLEYRGFLDYLVAKTQDVFDAFKNKMKQTWTSLKEWFMKTKVGKWASTKGRDFARRTGTALRSKFGYAKNAVKDSWNSTYGRLVNRARRGIIDAQEARRIAAEERVKDQAYHDELEGQFGYGFDYMGADSPVFQNRQAYEEANGYESMFEDQYNMAYGGVVKKYGMTMLSPGEIVIPNPTEAMRRNNLRGEMREKSRIMKALRGGNISHHAQGTVINGGKKEESNILKTIKKVMHEISGEGGDIAADALIGSGVSLITGMFGGPILGAAAGAGIGLVRHSETVQKALFGDIDSETGERKGGLISKETQDKFLGFFNKNGKSMLNLGIAGGIAGLFTPLGLVGGTIAGASIGYVKNTEWFQEMMFGNEVTGKQGLMSKETKAKLEKAFPAMAIGAGAGALLGPFGLVGNAVLGAGAGYLATSDRFREIILGVKGENGKRTGGLAGAVKDGLIKPMYEAGKSILSDLKDYVKDHIIAPTKIFMESSGQFVRNIFLSIGDRVTDALSGMFEKHVGMPFEEFMREKVFKRFSRGFMGLLKGGVGAIGKLIGLPFGGLGAIGNSMRARQIARGTADTLTAGQRNAFRRSHKFRLNKFTGGDKYAKADEMFESMDAAGLESMGANLQTFMKTRGTKRVAYNDMLRSTGDSISGFLTDNDLWNSGGYNLKKDIMNLMQTDSLNESTLSQLASTYKLSEKQLADLIGSIDIEGLNSARAAMISESGMSKEAIQQLEKATGIKNLHSGKNINLRRFNRLINTELKARKAFDASGGKTGTGAKVQTPEEKMADNSQKIIDILISINNALVSGGKGTMLDKNGESTDKMSSETKKVLEEKEKDDLNLGDGIEDVTARNKEKQKEKKKSWIMQKLEGFLGNKPKEEEKEEDTEKKGIVSRILGGAGSVFKSIFGNPKGTLGTLGLIAGGAVGLSLLGYGGDFLKTKVTPWMKEHVIPLFKGMFDKLIAPIVDGRLVSHMVQGVGFVFKNIAAPLTAAILKAFPSLIIGIGKGVGMFIKDLFGGEDKTVKTDFSTYLNNATRNMISGKDEVAIAKDFGGTVFEGMSSTGSEVDKFLSKSVSMSTSSTYATGKSNLDSGGTVDVDANGNVSMYDNDGNLIGEYNQITGDIHTTVLTKERKGLARRFGENAFKRSLATGRTSGIVRGAINLGNKIFTKEGIKRNAVKAATGGFGSKVFNGASGLLKTGAKITGETGGLASRVGTKLNQLFKKTNMANVGSDINSTLRTGAKNAIVNGADEGAGLIAKGASKMAKSSVSSGFLQSITSKVTKFFTWLGKSKLINSMLGILGKSVTKLSEGTLSGLFTQAGQKFAKLIAQQGAGKIVGKVGSKLLRALGNTTPLALGFWIKSFLDGAWFKTESLLGVAKDTLDITPGMRVLVGLTNAINDNLLLGLIPMELIMETIIGVFGSALSINNEELEAAKKETELLVTASGFESGDLKSLEEYNNQQGLLKKSWNALKNLFGIGKHATGVKAEVTENNTSSMTGTGRSISSVSGRGRGGQQGGPFARMRYGNTTIGEAGCAPVAAASMLGGNIPEAARFAQRTGHVAPDGSTDIGFFNDYFSAKGISNRTTTNKSDVNNALKRGQTAVMLGRDPGGGNDSAYSNSSHYITARGDGHGNVYVNDPALGRRKMPQSKVMKNMKASVIAGRGRSDPYDGNVDKIVRLAKDQVNTKEGYNNDNMYGKEFGMNHQPWCCIFVWWVFRHAGASKLFFNGKKTASCTELMNFYKRKGQQVSTAKRGDIVFFNFDKNKNPAVAKHVGICVADSDGKTVTCVEGNTSSGNSGSQDNGGGVYERKRKLSSVVCIVRPAYANATFDDAIPYEKGEFFDYGSGEQSSGGNKFGTLIDNIVDLGKSAVKLTFGDGLYNAVFGEDDVSSSGSADGITPEVDPNLDPSGNLTGVNNEDKIWKYLRSKGYSKEATAAIMGSLVNESGLKSNNIQNSYERKLGVSDASYTSMIDSGSYSADKFAKDSAGYGLAQWTYSARKKALYDATVRKGRSIANMKDQLDLLDREVGNYGLEYKLKTSKNIADANNIFIRDFEKPAGSENLGSSVYSTRLKSARGFYDKYSGTGRGYNNIGRKLSNETGRARDDSTGFRTAVGGTSYTQFLEAIINILISISDNTEALSKILDILSSNFNINVSSNDVKKSASDTKSKAKAALRDIMANKNDAEELSNILQTKDTKYLIDVMTNIARE